MDSARGRACQPRFACGVFVHLVNFLSRVDQLPAPASKIAVDVGFDASAMEQNSSGADANPRC
jgi:hypothetical protein